MPDLHGLLSRLATAGANARDRLMPVPNSLLDAGLISPDDVGNARRQGLLRMGISMMGDQSQNFGEALSHGLESAQEGYNGDIGSRLQTQQATNEIAQRLRLQKARQEIPQRFAEQPNETREQRIARLYSMGQAFLAAGDTETGSKILTLLGQIDHEAKGQEPKWEDFGGYKALMSPDGKVLQKVLKTPSPRDPNAPDTATQLRDQRMFTREQQLADDYNKDTKSARETAATKLLPAISEAPRAAAGDAAAQINMLYAFVSAMDPASAVREGEIGLARAATPVWQQANALLQKYSSGKSVVVTPGMVKSMSALMRRRYDGYQKYVGERSRYYGARAKHWGVGSEGLFPELDSLPSDTPTQSGANNVRQFLKK